jgi:hypothetical protein
MTTVIKNSVQAGKDSGTAHADNLIREYKQKRWVKNSEQIGKPDALSAWYSIEDMENFLADAKAHGADGIKFYYGAYAENYQPKPEYAGRQTLVLVATKSRISETGNTVNKDIYQTNKGKTKILSGISPSLCPPMCSSSGEGGMGDLGITLVDQGEKGMAIV